MRKKIVSALSVLLTLLMLLSLLPGCGESGSKPETASGSAKINSVEDLAGRKVATLEGSALIAEVIRQITPESEVVFYASVTDVINALQSGEVDAFVTEEASNRTRNYPELCVITELGSSDCAFLFPKTDAGASLRAEFNAFLASIRADGTFNEIDTRWFDAGESARTVDLSSLTGENGTLRFAVSTDVGEPFAYKKDGSCVGYDIDMAARFCAEHGYALEITDYRFTDLIAAVESGEADLGASCVTITEERGELVYFSDVNYSSSFQLVVRAADTDILSVEYLSPGDDSDLAKRFAGKVIGTETGTIHSETISALLPESEISFFNNVDEISAALENGEIDAYVDDEPTARMYIGRYEGQYIVGELEESSYAFAFPKGTEKSELLISQMNAFLAELKQSGDLKKIDEIWFGDDENKKVVNYSSLTGENGTLNFAVSSDTAGVFAYEKNGEYVGYDVDIAVRFCEKYGYQINITDSNFSAMLASVAGGRCDFAGSVITVTGDRKKHLDFSDSNYDGGVVLVSRERSDTDLPVLSDSSLLAALDGCKVGYVTGSIYDRVAEEFTPDSTIMGFNSVSDLCVALDTGILDGYYVDLPSGHIAKKYYPDQEVYAIVSLSDNAMIFPKGTLKSDILRSQVNQFLAEIKADGTFKEIHRTWFGEDESLKTVDYASLTGENGVLNVATSSMIGEPFSYMKDGQLVGYDLDMICRFCREYGYGMNVLDYDFAGMLAAVSSGKADIGAACITVTEERKEIMNFSDTNYYSGGALVTHAGGVAAGSEKKSGVGEFMDRIAESFQKTFIRESRWKLFARGIGTTICISLLAVLFGTALGFLTYLRYRKNRKLYNRAVDLICATLSKTPTVMILMILYYIVFVEAKIGGFWVSVIGFSILFTGTVITLLKVAVRAVPAGQREAALSLGYSESDTFMKVILPQSLGQFLPVYKGEIVSLIKSTAIVGYIAVQDLTKVSDLVRSRTFEPFFALVVSTLIYILIASLLIALVERLQIRTDPKKRSADKILKGVKRK